MMDKKLYLLSKMTWPEVKEALERVELGVVPVGSTEQHGPHATLDMDSNRVEKFCRLLGKDMYPKVLVAPTVNVGVSYHHFNFPGSLTLRSDTLCQVLKDLAWSLKQHGLKKVLFVNGHGGNTPTLSTACTKIKHELDMEAGWVGFLTIAGEVLEEQVTSETYGHSCEAEVSQMLYLDPDTDSVRHDKLQPGKVTEMAKKERLINMPYMFDEFTETGNLGDARKASVELGEMITEKAKAKIIDAIAEQFGVEV